MTNQEFQNYVQQHEKANKSVLAAIVVILAKIVMVPLVMFAYYVLSLIVGGVFLWVTAVVCMWLLG